jgi:hypothetical protein
MKRFGKTIDWTAVYCSQCGHTFNYKTGVRAPIRGIPGARWVLCSKVCAEKWYEGQSVMEEASV